MKKSSIIMIILAIFLAFSMTGCKKDKSKISSKDSAWMDATDEEGNVVYKAPTIFADVKEFFELDYSPEKPEPESIPKKVNLNNIEGSDEETTSFIPGVRELNKYKLSYQTKKISISEYLEKVKRESAFATGNEEGVGRKVNPEKSGTTSSGSSGSNAVEKAAKETEKGDLFVKYWGPSEEAPAEMSNPRFYVEFSLNVNPIAALTDQDEINKACEKLMKITPAVKGNYHWVGSKTLAFDVEGNLDSQVSYEITLSDSIKSIGGKPLTGTKKFTTKTAAIRVMYITSNCDSTGNTYGSSDYGVPLEHAKYFYVYTNGKIPVDVLQKGLTVSSNKLNNGNALAFSVKGSGNGEKNVQTGELIYTSFFVSLNFDMVNDDVIKVKYKDDRYGRTSQFSYETWYTFKLTETRRYSNSWEYGTGVRFTFNHPVDENSVKKAISVKYADFNSNNLVINRNEVVVKNLNVIPGNTVSVSLNGPVKSVNGDILDLNINETFEAHEYRGESTFIDYGNKILEAQFPHTYVFQYMNALKGSGFRVRSVTDPLYIPGYYERWRMSENDPEGRSLTYSEKNKRFYEEIDLNPYLNSSGKGFVSIETDLNLYEYDNYYEKDSSYSSYNITNIQVTDLAATVRFGINRAVVLVRSMEKNLPVEGAKVQLRSGGFKTKFFNTDSNGLAVLDLSDVYSKLYDGWSSENEIVVYIEKDDDKVMFYPYSHSSWRSGVYTSSIYSAYETCPRVFFFSDRGLYKPGETVSFKGIDRTQQLGMFKPYNGNYKIEFVRESWRDRTVYKTLTGKTSSSGGFDGSFVVPEDLEPGTYYLKYYRDGDLCQNISIQVAYFEGLKIQSSLELNNEVAISGDIITGKLNASYLAGGYLAGAQYEGNWYREPTYFHSSQKEFKKYSFGPSIDYYGKQYVSEDSGTLDSRGSVSLSLVGESKQNGVPYIYFLETYVTDESNQQISAAAIKTVHPAQFYLGVARPKNIRGFPKSKDTLEIPYVCLTPEDEVVSDMSITSGSVKYTLSREYWTYTYQKSVDGGVYGRYTEHNDVETVQSVKLDAKGILKITPQNAGRYTLQLESSDKKGRPVITTYKFYVTGADISWYSYSGENQLNLTPDQSVYNPGDTAQILLESPLPKGDYLITVEREGIFTQEVKHFDQSCSVIEVPIARNYTPVVYVSVASYSVRNGEPTHQFGERDMDKPKGYYGVTPVYIDPRVKAFSVDVKMDKSVYAPGDTATVTLTATRGGQPLEGAELTCMAADRAVLDLINYHVDDPIAYFYNTSNFPLRVRGGDSRAYLLDPVTYSVKDLQGGDEGEKEEDERNDFRPTAFFEPTLVTGKDGTVKFTFKVPSNLTTFRVTAFGVKDELLALQEDEFGVQNIINAQSVQPQRLRERDTAECGVVLTNLDNKSHEVTVSVAIRAPQKPYAENEEDGLVTVSGKAFIDGETSHTVKIGSGRTSVVYFDVAAEEKGNIELVYTVKSDVLSEKLVSKLLIDKTYVTETVAAVGSTDYVKNGTEKAVESIAIPSWANDGVGNVKVTLDPTRLGMLGSTVNYLFKYPYGCMEQQSSCVLPLVIFGEYIDVFGLNSEVSNPKKVVVSYLKNWKRFQLSNGSFPYWPEETISNYYVSLRIAHIAALAKQRGYSDKEIAINVKSLLNYLADNIPSEDYNYLCAYACYVFSMFGDSRLDSKLKSLDAAAYDNLSVAAYVGLAWANKSGQEAKEKAQKYANLIRSYTRPDLRSVTITQPAAMNWRRYFYYSNIGQLSTILQLFVTVDPTDEMVDRCINKLLTMQSMGGYWANTSTSARALESIYTVIKQRKLDSTDYNAKATLAGIELVSGNFKGAGAKPVENKEEFTGEKLKGIKRDTALPLEFSMTGTGTLYYNVELTYAMPDETLKARDEGISVGYEIYELDSGKQILPEKGTCIIRLKSGTTYKVVSNIDSKVEREYVAVRLPVPSGATILNDKFVTSGSDAKISKYNWNRTAIYDNEVHAFDKWMYAGENVLTYTFRAARRGVYPTPPAQAECMYMPEIFGRSDGYLIIIE